MNPSAPTRRSPWAWIPTLYTAQGLPYVLVMTVSVILYKGLGISNADIAFYTSWLYLPWVIKPLWSPVVDILRTRRWWIWTMQLLVGAGLAGIAFTIPTSGFFQYTLAFFWLLAFSSATHDIAADGFYLLATTEREQAFFVGIRSTFYRVATIFGQGLLVILAGYIQSHTGLEKLQLEVSARPGAAIVETFVPGGEGSRMEGELRLLAETNLLTVAPEPRSQAETTALLAAVKAWNTTHQFYRTRQTRAAGEAEEGEPSAWNRHVSAPLAAWLQRHFGRQAADTSDFAGNVGVVQLRLSAPPGREVVVTPAFRSGDKSIALAEGARLVFDDTNWNRPAAIAFQLDRKLRVESVARFEVRSGNIPLSWTITFSALVGVFLLSGAWHKFILPRPASDRPGNAANVAVFLREFFNTFGSFFARERIALLLLFLLFYRFAEAQLVKMALPFLLDGREAGGLGLTTGQVGLVYGTFGILALTCGGLLGGFVASRHGLKAWLWPMVFSIQLPNVIFVYLAYTQPEGLLLIALGVAIEMFGYGFGFTAYMLYMIYIARGKHQTAHYAICTGFMALGMMIPGMWSGWLQEIIGYQHFFVWIMLATLPGFLVVALIPLDREFGKRG